MQMLGTHGSSVKLGHLHPRFGFQWTDLVPSVLCRDRARFPCVTNQLTKFWPVVIEESRLCVPAGTCSPILGGA